LWDKFAADWQKLGKPTLTEEEAVESLSKPQKSILLKLTWERTCRVRRIIISLYEAKKSPSAWWNRRCDHWRLRSAGSWENGCEKVLKASLYIYDGYSLVDGLHRSSTINGAMAQVDDPESPQL